MDKSWMHLSRVSRKYSKGLDDFLDFAFTNASINGEIVCPCVKCGNGELLKKAHHYVLFNCNCEVIDTFISDHYNLVRDQNPRARKREIERIHHDKFSLWLRGHVRDLYHARDQRITEELRILGQGPVHMAKRYSGFLVNGFRFHVKGLEKRRTTQNSGVIINATTQSYSSAKDSNPILGHLTYYGVLKDVIELYYKEDKKVILFQCDWVSQGKRKREDEHGFTLVNFEGVKPHEEPFVLASQASQAFYVKDPTEKGWQVVIKTTARDTYDMSEQSSMDHMDTYLQSESFTFQGNEENENVILVREGANGVTVVRNVE